jgi:hypothetical protein
VWQPHGNPHGSLTTDWTGRPTIERMGEDGSGRGRRGSARGVGTGGGYFLGFIGALVYYLQQAHSFWSGVLAVLESFVWPALLVYHLLKLS